VALGEVGGNEPERIRTDLISPSWR
jgi:hypothetical protein